MQTAQFLALLKETHEKLLTLSATKGKEYAGSDDRLANFKRLGENLQLTPEKALWVYLTKHMDSLRTYINDTANGHTREYSEPITGRVDDAILYLMLLKGLIVEREGLTGDLHTEEIPAHPLDRQHTIESMQDLIRGWADEVFPSRTAELAVQKLIRHEIPEFLHGGLGDPHEYADLVILILDIASLQGINVAKAVREKMFINMGRNWKIDPGTGLAQHVE